MELRHAADERIVTRPTRIIRGRWPRISWIGGSSRVRSTGDGGGDITFLPTDEGWLYLAAVEDLGSRLIVGWSMAETMTSRLVVEALERGWNRRPPGEGLLTHPDRGSPSASAHYQQRLSEHGIRCRMSRRGNGWDNAPMESFFATRKKELVHDARYVTRAQAKASLFESIEGFDNRVRLHSSLGYRSPAEYEKSL
jgi:putative transposase